MLRALSIPLVHDKGQCDLKISKLSKETVILEEQYNITALIIVYIYSIGGYIPILKHIFNNFNNIQSRRGFFLFT